MCLSLGDNFRLLLKITPGASSHLGEWGLGSGVGGGVLRIGVWGLGFGGWGVGFGVWGLGLGVRFFQSFGLMMRRVDEGRLQETVHLN